MGWEEMLLQEDRQRLVVWYLSQGDCGENLKKWVKRGGESRAETTPEMRAKVGEELAGLLTVQREITEGTLQLADSRNDEYRRRTPAWWRDNLNADGHFEDMLYECLDYMAAVVGAGVETRLAWSYVLTCVRQDNTEV